MRRRLAIAAAGLTSAVVLAFCVPLGLVVRYLAIQRAVDSAELESRSLAAVLATVHDPSVITAIVAEANASSSTPVTVYLPTGSVVGEPQPPSPNIDIARKGRAFTTNGPHGSRDVYVPVRGSSGAISVIRVSAPASLLHRGVARSWVILGGLAALLLVIAVGLADRMARTMVGPVEQLVAVTERLREGDLGARSQPEGPPEIAEVAVAVNLLADRIVDLIATERERAADLSHRLRTPLTALRLDVESVSDRDERARLTADIDAVEQAMARIIRDARRPAVSPSGGPSPSDLETVVEDRMAFWAVLAEDQRRAWSVDLPENAHRVSVARADLDAALDALLANVFAHTPEGTAFSVSVCGAANGRSVLVVEDDGPGIADPSVSERGRSGRRDGLGTGLGLDIARRTAEAGGGAFRVLTGPRGGCRVELELVGASGSGDGDGRPRQGRADRRRRP
jgi:signal transduction histidine kinase